MEICFENIIALSRTECDCPDYQDPNPIDPVSGYYIDEQEGLTDLIPALISSIRCGEENIYETFRDIILPQARQDVLTDLVKANKSNKFKGSFKKEIGTKYKNGYATQSGNYTVVKIKPKPVRCAYLCINRIGLIPFQNLPLKTVSLYDDRGQFIASYPIQTEQYNVAWVDVNYKMDIDSCKYIYVVYENDEKPRKQSSSCSSCTRSKSTTSSIDVGAVQVSEIDQETFLKLNHRSCITKKLDGVALDLTFDCDIADTFCKINPKSEDYDLIAEAVMYKAITLLVAKIVYASNIRYEAVAKKEMWLGLRNHYNKLYKIQMYGDENVSGIATNLDLSFSGCVQNVGLSRGYV